MEDTDPTPRDAGIRRRAELAAFLRSRRAALAPEQVGLPATRRRRTPGLRREEVAELADVGLSWYTWLEQARDITPSPQVLESIARALRLTPSERDYLLRLANSTPSGPSTLDPGRPSPDPELVAMVHALVPHPAYLLNDRFDVVAHNSAAELVLASLLNAAPEQRNLLLWLFQGRGEWSGHDDAWSRTARANVLDFRIAHANHPGEPAFDRLVDQLVQTGEPFTTWWADHDVASLDPHHKVLQHAELGELAMLQLQTHLPAAGLRLRILVPADAPTRSTILRATHGAASERSP